MAAGSGSPFDEVVGRRREVELVLAALAAGRHLLLEGPPGTGKSTLLRTIAEASDTGFELVEGNAELTPARLVGTFDPAAVLEAGYSPDVFMDGPLASALREGSLLYVEEINRIPEETLNVLIGVMSEGELHVPRLGRIPAASGFRLVAAMNPFDSVGTARIASALYDRCCRLTIDYQSRDDEVGVVAHVAPGSWAEVGSELGGRVVEMVRATREHPDLRTGSSVRGAIDLVLLLHELARVRATAVDDPSVTLDASLLALSGRVRTKESSSRSSDEIVTELWQRHLAPQEPASDAAGDGGAPPKH
jgi:MoxR-like ATPase